MKKIWMAVAVAGLLCGRTFGQDVTGDWQGTLKVGSQQLRLIFHIVKDEQSGLKGTMYSIDQTPQPLPATVTEQGASVKIAVGVIGGGYDGKLSADGKLMTGTWTQGASGFPLDLAKATPETAWGIPEAPKPEKAMAANADPAFAVATIKPNPSGGGMVQQFTMIKRGFVVKNGSLMDLVKFAYGVDEKQVLNAPDWITKDRYDIQAVPDTEGQPDMAQLRTMVKKLVADRFALKEHKEKREMQAYVLTVAKAGEKLKPTDAGAMAGSLPGMGISPGTGGLTLHMRNATMDNTAEFLQMLVLDSPVVNDTGISGRYDLDVTFTPDQSQFNGNAPKVSVAEGTEPAPALDDAFERQEGIKMTHEKASVDVLVVDHVEKPSAN